jgi:hypothetical protein
MRNHYANVRGLIQLAPSLLLNQRDNKVVKSVANSILRWDTGLEIECEDSFRRFAYNERDAASKQEVRFAKDMNHGSDEKRWRIPTGVEGLVCLSDISGFLTKYCYPNTRSGIHYHIDCTEIKDWDKFTNFCLGQSWMLDAIKHWGYTGKYNSWKISINKEAIKIHEDYKTIEFRIGEMTFDYQLLLKRISNCQNIINRLKYLYKRFLSEESHKGTKVQNKDRFIHINIPDIGGNCLLSVDVNGLANWQPCVLGEPS